MPRLRLAWAADRLHVFRRRIAVRRSPHLLTKRPTQLARLPALRLTPATPAGDTGLVSPLHLRPDRPPPECGRLSSPAGEVAHFRKPGSMVPLQGRFGRRHGPRAGGRKRPLRRPCSCSPLERDDRHHHHQGDGRRESSAAGGLLLLGGLCLIGALLVGYGSSEKEEPQLVPPAVFAAMLSLTVYVIIDLEFPRLGLIRIDAADSRPHRAPAGHEVTACTIRCACGPLITSI